MRLSQSSSIRLSAPNGAQDTSRIDVSITEAPGEMILRIAGKGCVGQADALAGHLLGLSARHPSSVRLDLSGLTCISSLSMGVLATFCRGVVRAGGRVNLGETLPEPVRAALEQAGLFSLFGSSGGCEICQVLFAKPRTVEAHHEHHSKSR